jgi:hypothetical protein
MLRCRERSEQLRLIGAQVVVHVAAHYVIWCVWPPGPRIRWGRVAKAARACRIVRNTGNEGAALSSEAERGNSSLFRTRCKEW